MMQALAAYDPLDPASADVPVPDYRAALADKRLDGMRIGVIRHWHERDAVAGFGPDSAPSPTYVAVFDAACRTLDKLGARLVDIKMSPLLDFVDANRVIMMAEAYALHESDFRERPHLFGRHMFARIGLGAFLSAADYIEAVRTRRELCTEMAEVLAGVDVIVSANTTGPAPRIDLVGTYATFDRASTRRRTTSPDCRRCRCRSGSRTDCPWPSRSPASRSTRPRCCAPVTPSSRPASSG